MAARIENDVLAALDDLLAALDANRADADRIVARAEVIKAERAKGRPWSDIVPEGEHPLIPELVSEMLDRLARVGSRVRREEANALHDEGMSMEAIGELFGVTRQRVSALLRPLRDEV